MFISASGAHLKICPAWCIHASDWLPGRILHHHLVQKLEKNVNNGRILNYAVQVFCL